MNLVGSQLYGDPAGAMFCRSEAALIVKVLFLKIEVMMYKKIVKGTQTRVKKEIYDP